VEAKWFKPMNKRRNTLGMRGQFSFVSGYGGLQAPIYDRFYMGGEDSLRGFDIRVISPRALVTQRTFNQVTLLDPTGAPVIDPTTGGTITNNVPVYVSFPYSVGGDTQAIYNIEYRIPIVGPVTLAPFFDLGKTWVWKKSSLTVADAALTNFYKYENGAFRPLHSGEALEIIPETTKARASTGLEIQVVLPVINAPFRLIYFYNPLQLNSFVQRPEGGFPYPIYDNYDQYGVQRRSGFKFSVGRTF